MAKNGRVVQLIKCVRPVIDFSDKSLEYRLWHDKIPNYFASGLADTTENSYYLAFCKYKMFCHENGEQPLPVKKDTLMVYFVKLIESKQSVNPVLMARSAIKHYHLLAQPSLQCPTDSPDVSLLINSFKRKYTKPVCKKLPITVDIVKSLIHLFLGDDILRSYGYQKSVLVWRGVIKTIFKFVTFARFEEAVQLKLSNLKLLPSGDIEVSFPKGKNYQFHEARKVVIAKTGSLYCPVKLILNYTKVLNYKVKDGFFLP